MDKFKYINEEVKTKLDDLSKKIVNVNTMDDAQLLEFASALQITLKTLQQETNEVVAVLKKEMEVVNGEKQRRGIEKAHANQLSLFDTKALLENMEEE